MNSSPLTELEARVFAVVQAQPQPASAITAAMGRSLNSTLIVLRKLRDKGMVANTNQGTRTVWCMPWLEAQERARVNAEMLRHANAVRNRKRAQQRAREAERLDALDDPWLHPVQRGVAAHECPPVGRTRPFSVFHQAGA